MAACDALDPLPQIQILVSDRLQVVSYKWLSRNFSVSSNNAKRFLQKFVDKHGNDLEVIYTLSGWLKSNPGTYCVKLASGPRLQEAREEFKDSCSVQVYSVQACIPKDIAALWSAEFAQTEELFNQPSTEENCLRDNRFCGVSNSLVKRSADGKHESSFPLKPVNAIGTAAQPKPSSAPKDQPVLPPKHGSVTASSPNTGASDKADTDSTAVNAKSTKPLSREPTDIVQPSKTKDQKGKISSGNTGSIASLWGRASKISKRLNSATETKDNVCNIAVTADAQICANEAADAASSGDDREQDIGSKRESKGTSTRKRRVLDFSDDEEENVISLASPEPPKEPTQVSLSKTESMTWQQKNLDQKTDMVDNWKEKVKEGNCGLSSEVDSRNGSKGTTAEISIEEKINSNLADSNKNNVAMDSAPALPKRRKVLKTRMDERGREVTEVVWEGEDDASDKSSKDMPANDAPNRPSTNKTQVSGNSDQTNLVSRTGGNKKPTKGGGKDAKQGSIMLFFKKS